jgi:quercetin 2,3-dioxygenase
MITVRLSAERLHTKIGWLDSRHSFSFGEHYDPRYMGYRALRVINEDRVAPGQGFGTHPHRDMEIVSYVLDGALRHQDSLGTGSIIRPGDVQRMTAGTGVLHSEFNASEIEPVHFLQIWIVPEKHRLQPAYEQRNFPLDARRGHLTLIASRDARQGSVCVHQDVDVYSSVLAARDAVVHPLAPGRHAWIQIARGTVDLNGMMMRAGDGAAATEEPTLRIAAADPAELLLFDLA